MDRRQFLSQSVLLPAAAAGLQGEKSAHAQVTGAPTLRDKFYGCVVGVHVGSALKGPCEGWPWPEIQAKYGTIDHMIGYQDYHNGWNRLPGTTEDGVERQKFIITAIMEKKDRVTAEDVRAAWVRDMKPEAASTISEPFEGVLLAMAKSGIPACDIGRYCDYAGLISMGRSCHPLGLINAGDIEAAANDVFEVGQLYQTTNSRGLQWAAVTGIAVASATKPGATVDSVIGDILKGQPRFSNRGAATSQLRVVEELERGLKLTEKCKDFRELRVAFDSIYNGKGMAYPTSFANEVITRGVCIFYMVKGNTKDAMIAGVNLGRDTDCTAAVAAGISGALTGAGSVPAEWITQVDYATSQMPVTCTKRTIRQHADGVYEAYVARLRKMRSYVEQMETA